MKADVAVIGAGVAGMSAAATLARHGRRVVLVEQAPRPGPLLRRFHRAGHPCDGGFHYSGGLHPGGAIEVLFRYFGAPGCALEPVALDPAGFDTLISPRGRTLRVPTGFGPLGEALGAAFPASAAAGAAYAAELQRRHRATPFLFFDFAHAEVMHRRKNADLSLAAFLAGAGAEPDLIETLGGYGLALYGTPGEEIPFDYHSMVIGSLCYSAHALRRGGDAIVWVLEDSLARLGVEVLCGRPAEAIRTAGGQVTGVELEGERIECGACIFTGHPQILPRLLGGEATPGLRARLEGSKNTFGLFTIFMHAETVPAALRAGNVYRVLGEEDTFGVLGPTPEVAQASCPHPEAGKMPALPGGVLLALRPSHWGGGGDAEYAEYKARETEEILAGVLELLPELRGRIRVLATASPRTYERMTGTVGGAAYGLRRTVGRRSVGPMTGIGGLYLAGHSTLISGVVSVMISGLIAAALVTGIEPIWEEVKKSAE